MAENIPTCGISPIFRHIPTPMANCKALSTNTKRRCVPPASKGSSSAHVDRTLQFINRGHNYAQSAEAIRRTADAGILTGAHLILGLPGESEAEILSHADRLSELPLSTLKLHQLQLIKHTRMAQQYAKHPEWFRLYGIDEYIDLAIDFAERLNPDIVIERFVSQSPAELLIAPHWGLKNHEFTARLLRRMKERNSRQGDKYGR